MQNRGQRRDKLPQRRQEVTSPFPTISTHSSTVNSSKQRYFTFPRGSAVCRRQRVHHWSGEIPWRREWQPTPGFLPGKCHGQRNLAGYGPWGHKKSDRAWKLVVNHFINKRKSLGLAPGSVSFSYNMCGASYMSLEFLTLPGVP